MFSNEILFLAIVKNHSRLSILNEKGLTYSQISMLIDSQEEEGNIVRGDFDIFLTPKGLKNLEENVSKINSGYKEDIILPQVHLYKKPIPINTIVLPKKI